MCTLYLPDAYPVPHDRTPRRNPLTVQVPPGYREYERLDVYLTNHIANATRAKVQAGIREGRVTVGGKVVTRVAQKVQPNDTLVCRVLRPPPLVAAPEDLPLDIVYEDDDLIVVNKDAGMVVHPAYGNRTGTLVNALLHHVGAGALSMDDEDDEPDDEELGLSTVNVHPSHADAPVIRPGIVHRIDKGTSGLLVVAKNDVAHAHLARQFMAHTVYRRYRALVWGVPEQASGTVETALGRDPRDRKKMAVVKPETGKHAITHYEVLEAHAHTAWLEFRAGDGPHAPDPRPRQTLRPPARGRRDVRGRRTAARSSHGPAAGVLAQPVRGAAPAGAARLRPWLRPPAHGRGGTVRGAAARRLGVRAGAGAARRGWRRTHRVTRASYFLAP